ncbi:hypothetical protein [Sphingomonas sp. R86521]|uniref:hypothetical protein n=1 Tax=Sphingomonas sp. R86521 TaxID=3093860 RepID=UPI0036D24394
MTKPVKSDPVALLALGNRMGLQGFEAPSLSAANEPRKQPIASAKHPATATRDQINATVDVSAILTLAKAARLQCVADEAGAL